MSGFIWSNLLHFGLLNYHHFFIVDFYLNAESRWDRGNTFKRLFYDYEYMNSHAECLALKRLTVEVLPILLTCNCYRDQVGLNLPKVKYIRSFLGVTVVRMRSLLKAWQKKLYRLKLLTEYSSLFFNNNAHFWILPLDWTRQNIWQRK